MQLNNYCKQKIQRLDMSIIYKLCYVFERDIGNILKYAYLKVTIKIFKIQNRDG